MKIYIRMINYPDPEPGDADPVLVDATCVDPCCDFARRMFEKEEEMGGYKIHYGWMGGGPTLSMINSGYALPYNYCMNCGAKVVQSTELPAHLSWKLKMIDGLSVVEWNLKNRVKKG